MPPTPPAATDGGAERVVINEGLRTRSVNQLALSVDGQHLYAATEGEGVYRLDLDGEPPEVAPREEPEPGTTPVPRDEPAPEEDVTPEPESESGGGICGGALTLPLALLLVVFLIRLYD